MTTLLLNASIVLLTVAFASWIATYGTMLENARKSATDQYSYDFGEIFSRHKIRPEIRTPLASSIVEMVNRHFTHSRVSNLYTARSIACAFWILGLVLWVFGYAVTVVATSKSALILRECAAGSILPSLLQSSGSLFFVCTVLVAIVVLLINMAVGQALDFFDDLRKIVNPTKLQVGGQSL